MGLRSLIASTARTARVPRTSRTTRSTTTTSTTAVPLSSEHAELLSRIVQVSTAVVAHTGMNRTEEIGRKAMCPLHFEFVFNSTGKSGCKTKAHLIGASSDAICDATHRNEAIPWRLAVKLRGSSCAVCNATLNPWTLSEVKLLMLFFPSLTAGCVSSEQRILVTTGTTTSSYEA